MSGLSDERFEGVNRGWLVVVRPGVQDLGAQTLTVDPAAGHGDVDLGFLGRHLGQDLAEDLGIKVTGAHINLNEG